RVRRRAPLCARAVRAAEHRASGGHSARGRGAGGAGAAAVSPRRPARRPLRGGAGGGAAPTWVPRPAPVVFHPPPRFPPLFTPPAELPRLLLMPPSASLAALVELAHSNFAGEHVARAMRQIGGWLAGPSEAVVMAPLNAAAILVLVRVALWRGADPWLRLTA